MIPLLSTCPDSSKATVPYNSLSTRIRTAAKGNPRQMWILVQGGESQRHGKKGDERNRRRKELVNNKKAKVCHSWCSQTCLVPGTKQSQSGILEEEQDPGCASAMEFHQIPHGTSPVTQQEERFQANEEERDASLQDRLQENCHTAPEGESRPPLIQGEEKDSSQKTPHIFLPLNVTIKDHPKPQVPPFPMPSHCQGTPHSTWGSRV